MSATTAPRVRSTSLDRSFIGRAIVLFVAVGQLGGNLAFDLWSPTELQSGVEFSPLVPPGAMFSIWAVIITASILWAILQVRPSVRQSALRGRLVAPLTLVYIGFSLWLAAAALGQQAPLTLVVFVLIVGAHVVAWRRITAARDEIAQWKPVDRVVLYLSQGLYAGWTSMAFFVNIATVMQAAGAPIDGAWGTTWQLLVIAAAAGVAVVFVVVTGGSVWYAIASCYALVGAGISSSLGGFTVLAVLLGVGVALIVGSTLVLRVLSARLHRRVTA